MGEGEVLCTIYVTTSVLVYTLEFDVYVCMPLISGITTSYFAFVGDWGRGAHNALPALPSLSLWTQEEGGGE